MGGANRNKFQREREHVCQALLRYQPSHLLFTPFASTSSSQAGSRLLLLLLLLLTSPASHTSPIHCLSNNGLRLIRLACCCRSGTSSGTRVELLLRKCHEGVHLADVDVEGLARLHNDTVAALAVDHDLERLLEAHVAHEGRRRLRVKQGQREAVEMSGRLSR